MKIFISGPMKNKPNGNKEAFFEAEYKLKRLGYSVFNPAWCQYGYDTEFTEDDMHMIDFSALSRCDAIYMLKGWQYSKGAQAEYDHAKILCKAILREGDPITDPLICDKYDWESFKNKLPSYRLYSNKNTPVFDREFALDEEIKNRTNYQFEAIKGNIRAKYTELKDITENLDISIGNESDRINSLKCEVESIKESIGTDNLQEQLEKDFADVYEEFQNTKDQVNDINMGYIKWSSEVSQFDERIEKLEENMKEIAANGGLGLSFNLMNERVSSNKRDISSLRNDIATIKDSIDNQRCTLDVISERVDKHYKKHSDDNKVVNNALTDFNIRLKAIEKRLNIAPISDKIDELKTINDAITDFNVRLKAIEKRLSIKPFYAPTEDEKDD